MKNRERMLQTTTYDYLLRLNDVLRGKGHCIFDIMYKTAVVECWWDECGDCVQCWLNAEEEETRTAEQFEAYMEHMWRKNHGKD